MRIGRPVRICFIRFHKLVFYINPKFRVGFVERQIRAAYVGNRISAKDKFDNGITFAECVHSGNACCISIQHSHGQVRKSHISGIYARHAGRQNHPLQRSAVSERRKTADRRYERTRRVYAFERFAVIECVVETFHGRGNHEIYETAIVKRAALYYCELGGERKVVLVYKNALVERFEAYRGYAVGDLNVGQLYAIVEAVVRQFFDRTCDLRFRERGAAAEYICTQRRYGGEFNARKPRTIHESSVADSRLRKFYITRQTRPEESAIGDLRQLGKVERL